MGGRIAFKYPFKANIRLYENPGLFNGLECPLIVHFVYFNQITDNDGSATTDPCSAYHQTPLVLIYTLRNDLMSFIKMIFDMIVRHVIDVKYFKFDAKFIIWHYVLVDPIDSYYTFYSFFLNFLYVHRRYLTSNIQVWNNLLKFIVKLFLE